MRTPEIIHATYRITTPMFCSGADQQAAELRLPSIKGALRFWWRALMWGRVNGVEDLQRKEAALFGASDQSHGQSKVRLQWAAAPPELQVSPPEQWRDGKLQGAHYLGYGVMAAFASKKNNTKPGQLKRPMIPSGVFTLECRLAPTLDNDQRAQFRNALILLGTVGGLGSKSRKGFGSLTLTEMRGGENDGGTPPPDPASRLRQVFAAFPLQDGLPEWTAWSTQSRLIVTRMDGEEDASDHLDLLGREQVHYRSWGNNGRVLGKDREGNFKEDHDLSKKSTSSIAHPRRVAFGLPHNYGKGTANEVSPSSKDRDRRASPLFLHIHKIDGRPPVGVTAFLPARFLPENEKVRAFGNTVDLNVNEDFWQPVHGYLDRLIGKPGATTKKTDLRGEEVTLG